MEIKTALVYVYIEKNIIYRNLSLTNIRKRKQNKHRQLEIEIEKDR